MPYDHSVELTFEIFIDKIIDKKKPLSVVEEPISSFKKIQFFTLTYYNLCISTSILKHKISTSTLHLGLGFRLMGKL